MASANAGGRSVRMTVRVDSGLHERAKFWAEKDGFDTVNDWVAQAMEEKINRHNGYVPDMGDLYLNRFNELVDVVAGLRSDMANTTTIVQTGFDSIVSMARGDSMLDDELDGELDR